MVTVFLASDLSGIRIEVLFDVKVDKVQVLNVKGKTKRFAQQEGRRNSWKKAYVSLQEGFDIEFMGSE